MKCQCFFYTKKQTNKKTKKKLSFAVVVIDALRVKTARKYFAGIGKNPQSHKQTVHP